MAEINITCEQCGVTSTVKRTDEIPDDVVSLGCNWCPLCDAYEDYYEWQYKFKMEENE